MARVQRRRLKDDDYTDDRISMLPNEILVLILSSLSFKEAMATSSLSSRWKNLWMLTSKLDFHIDFVETLKRRRYGDRHKFGIQCFYVKWVDRIFTRLRAVKPSTNLVEFRLSFDLPFSFFAPWINDWLSYAVSRKVERLDLILVAYQGEKRYSFPYKEGNFPANLKLLKILSLHYVDVSRVAVAFILGNCRLLEHLSLHQIGALSSLEAVGTSPVFKCLEISECTSLKSVVVRGSELVCIKYNGVGNLASCRFVLVDVPLLTQLWIQAKPRLSDLIAMLDMFEPVFPQLHTLKIYSTSIISYKIHSEVKMMPNLKQFVMVLVGSDYCDKCSLMPWYSVISAPCLERVVVEASHQEKSKNYYRCCDFHLPFFIGDGDPNGDGDRNVRLWDRDKIRNSYFHIKEVEFVGYRGVSNQFQMINQFVEYGTALDKVIVDPRSFKHRWHMPWDRIYRNHMEDEIFVRNRARYQFKDSRINVTIL